jgi:hypothetical protein
MKFGLRLAMALFFLILAAGCASTPTNPGDALVQRETVAAEDLPFFDYLSKRQSEGLTQNEWRYARWYYHSTKDLSPAERKRFSAEEVRRLDAGIEREWRAIERLEANPSPSFFPSSPTRNQPFPSVPPSYTISPYGYGTTIRGSDGSVMTCTPAGKDQICR